VRIRTLLPDPDFRQGSCHLTPMQESLRRFGVTQVTVWYDVRQLGLRESCGLVVLHVAKTGKTYHMLITSMSSSPACPYARHKEPRFMIVQMYVALVIMVSLIEMCEDIQAAFSYSRILTAPL
jgi:hypothetical protein